MFDLILYAIPVFVALLAAEWISFRHGGDDRLRGYEVRDTFTSLAMGSGNVLINFGWKLVVLTVYAEIGMDLVPSRRRRPPARLRGPRHVHEPRDGLGQRAHQLRLEARGADGLRRDRNGSRSVTAATTACAATRSATRSRASRWARATCSSTSAGSSWC